MKPYRTKAHINSLGGKMAKIIVLDKPDENKNCYIVEYNGVKCTAIFNWFAEAFYADDVYGVVK